MPLEDSPDWDEFFGFPDGFVVYVQEESDLWIEGFGSFYIATGGAQDPNMKVSIGDVDVSGYETYSGLVGGVSRLSEDSSGYAALYFELWNDGVLYYHRMELWVFYNSDYDILFYDGIPGCPSSISITAPGENPVHISAWFDEYQLTYDDYEYNLTGSYGGIYAEWTMGGYCCLDDFLEEEVYENIKPVSLGYIKALMSD